MLTMLYRFQLVISSLVLFASESKTNDLMSVSWLAPLSPSTDVHQS